MVSARSRLLSSSLLLLAILEMIGRASAHDTPTGWGTRGSLPCGCSIRSLASAAAGGVPGHPGAGALRRVMTAFLWRTRQQDRRSQRISVRGDNVCCLDRSRVGATAPIMPCGKTANDSRHAIRTDYRHAVLAGGIRDFPVPERVMCKAVRCLPPPSRAGCPSPSHRPTDARVE